MLRAIGAGLILDVNKAADQAGTAGAKTLNQKLSVGMKKAATVGGAAIGAFVAGGVQEFSGFQESMNEVFTLLPGITKDAMGKMEQDVEAFSRATGRTTDEVIPALYQALSAGVPQDNVFAFLETANKAAVAGVASTEDSVNLLSAVTKAYGDTSQGAVDKVADLAFQTVKLGQTTFPELAASIGKVTPLAAALGVTQEELFGITATLTGVTGNTAEVFTQQKAVMTALIKTNPQMTATLKEMGFGSGEAAVKSLGLKGTLLGLQEATGGNTQQMAEMLGSTEALTASLALTGAQSEVATDKIGQMGETTGSVDTAFETMDSGVGATTRKMMAHIRTFAIDVGRQFEDLGPIFVLFGPTIGRAIGAGFGGLAGFLIPKLLAQIGIAQVPVVAASGAMGTAAGTAMGAAIPIAMVAAAGIGIALAFKSIFLDPGLQEQSRAIGAAVGDQIVTGTTDQLKQSQAAIAQGIADINALPLGGFLYGDQIRDLEAQAEVVNAEIERRATETGAAIPPALADGAATTMPEWSGALEDVVTFFGTKMSGVKAAAKVVGADGMAALAAGITAARQKPADAFATMVEMLKHALTPLAEVSRLKGELASDELKDGLKSGDPALRAQALAVVKGHADRLAELAVGDGKAGKAAMAELNKGIRSKIPAVALASLAAKNAALADLEAAKKPAGAAGVATAGSFVDGYTSVLAKPRTITFSPRIGIHARNRATGGPVAAGALYRVNERTARSEYFMADVPGRILTPSQAVAVAPSAGGGAPLTVNVYNPAPEPASTSTRRELRKLALAGSAL